MSLAAMLMVADLSVGNCSRRMSTARTVGAAERTARTVRIGQGNVQRPATGPPSTGAGPVPAHPPRSRGAIEPGPYLFGERESTRGGLWGRGGENGGRGGNCAIRFSNVKS